MAERYHQAKRGNDVTEEIGKRLSAYSEYYLEYIPRRAAATSPQDSKSSMGAARLQHFAGYCRSVLRHSGKELQVSKWSERELDEDIGSPRRSCIDGCALNVEHSQAREECYVMMNASSLDR